MVLQEGKQGTLRQKKWKYDGNGGCKLEGKEFESFGENCFIAIDGGPSGCCLMHAKYT